MDPIQTDQSTAGQGGSTGVQAVGNNDIGSDELFKIQSVSGDAIYDEMMGAIEPELISSQIDGLAEKYKNETPEEAEARKTRYNAAYAEYEKRLSEYLTQKQSEATSRKRKAMSSIEKEDRKVEDEQLSNLESSIFAP